MTAHEPNSDERTTPEAAATEPPAAPNQAGEDTTDASPATPTEDAEPEVDDKAEEATAPETEPPSRKKSAKSKKAKRSQTRKDAGAKPKNADKEETAKTTGSASSDSSPNLRCLQVIRESAPALPSGILPPEIDKLFPESASRGALASAFLSTVAAAAGHAVVVAGGKEEGQGGVGLRVAIISDTASLASIIAPVLQPAYAVQMEETKAWVAAKQKEAGQAAVVVVRQRILQQTVANAALLGLNGLAETEVAPTASPAVPAPRPCFVLRDPVPTAVKQALANTGKGLLMVDGTKMTTLAGWGTNYLTDLANLLNDANAGELLELADPLAHGAVRMRCAHVSVIGMLSTLDTFGLYKAKPKELAETLFVPIETASKTIAVSAAKVLTAMLTRLRALEPEDEGKLCQLRLSADARKTLEQLKRRLIRAANEVLSPLADVYTGAADLALRIAALLHLLDHAVSGADQLPNEIENVVMQRAVDFVEQYALPAARNVLGPASIDPIQRDARRVLSCAQQNMAPEEDVTVRELRRHLRRGMDKLELQQAVRLLVDDSLLSPKTPGGSQAYILDPLVFAPKNRLPDLAGDPRRPKH